mmetsp:Transcript_3370/g.7210  ORF Transcript_3370/g.7210 Transcript_3370/m.7210 type:complete len:916 (+) Transcript_3370:130-2877(+)
MSSEGGTVVQLPPQPTPRTAPQNATTPDPTPASEGQINSFNQNDNAPATKNDKSARSSSKFIGDSSKDHHQEAIASNVEKRNAKRDERKRELLMEARQARMDWILRAGDSGINSITGIGNHEQKNGEGWDRKSNPLRSLKACGEGRLPCVPDVIENMLTCGLDTEKKRQQQKQKDDRDRDAKIASTIQSILEKDRLSWSVVANEVSTKPQSQLTPALPTDKNPHPLLANIPAIIPHPSFYQNFLTILCQPPSADLVLSIQKFCKTMEEAARVMTSVQDEHYHKLKELEMREWKEKEKKSLDSQHSLRASPKRKDGMTEKDTASSAPSSQSASKSAPTTSLSSKPPTSESTTALLNQKFDHAASLAKAIRGFINSTLREMEGGHPSFHDILHSQHESSTSESDNDNVGNNQIKQKAKEQLQASLEKFLYIQCRDYIDSVLQGEIDPVGEEDNSEFRNDATRTETSRDSDTNGGNGNTTTASSGWKTMRESDAALHEKMMLLQFVTPAHLEIECLKHKFDNSHGVKDAAKDENADAENYLIDLTYSVEKLKSIQHQASPRQMLQNILLAHRGISIALNAAVDETTTGTTPVDQITQPSSSSTSFRNPNHQPPGADDILPTLILAVLRAHPQSLWKNLRFIEHFAPPSLLLGEMGYAYTNLCGATHFLKKLDMEGHLAEVTLGGLGEGAVLSIGPEEFRVGLEECRKRLSEMENEKKGKSYEGDGDYHADSNDDQKLANSSVDSDSDDYDIGEGTFDAFNIKISPRDIRDARAKGESINLDWALRKQNEWMQQCGKFSTNQRSISLVQTSTREPDINNLGSLLPPETPPLPPKFSRSYSFLGVRPDDIRLSDLPKLLKEYQMLVHATESLLNERTTWRDAERKRLVAVERRSLEKSYQEVLGMDDDLENTANGIGKIR